MAACFKVTDWADGGTTMIESSGGSPTAVSTPAPPNGAYAMRLDDGDYITMTEYLQEFPATGTGPWKTVAKIRFEDLSPTDAYVFMRFRNTGGTTSGYTHIGLRLKNDGSGDVEVLDAEETTVLQTISSPFTVNTWHQISIWVEISATGDAEIVIDGTSYTFSNQNFQSSVGTAHAASNWTNAGGDAGTYFYVTEILQYESVTSNSDVPDDGDVVSYRSGGSPSSGGDALDAGSWANAGEQPANTSNTASYTQDAPLAGWADCDDTGGGPASDASTPTTTYLGGSYFFIYSRGGGGGGGTKELLVGNSSYTGLSDYTAHAVNPGTSPAGFHISYSSGSAIIPTSAQDASMGMNHAGGRDSIMNDMYFMLGVEPAGDAPETATTRSFVIII